MHWDTAQTKGPLLAPVVIEPKECLIAEPTFPSTPPTTLRSPLAREPSESDSFELLKPQSRTSQRRSSRGRQETLAVVRSFLVDSKRRFRAPAAVVDPQSERRLQAHQPNNSRTVTIHTSPAFDSTLRAAATTSSPSGRQREKPRMPHSGARPLRPAELDGFWKEDRNKEIVNRGDYLVQNRLEVPPHIKIAYEMIKREGLGWGNVDEKRILGIIDSLPQRLFEAKAWRRDNLVEPCPATNPDYYEIMKRVFLSEQEFYGIDKGSPGGKLLEQIREPSTTPHSFKWHLKQAGVSVDRIFNFTNTVCKVTVTPGGRLDGPEATWPVLQFQNQHRRMYFIRDMARYLRSKPNGHSELPHEVFFIRDAENRHRFLEEGILKINARTLVYDSTHDSSLLKLMQEVDIKPGVIIKQLTFWRNGDDDARTAGGKQAPWCDFYDVPHWLSDNYDVYYRSPGSGFVSCHPTIYIRKGKPSLLSRLAP